MIDDPHTTHCEAIDLLKKAGISIVRGVIRPKAAHMLTDQQNDAINYLCAEWDYDYEPGEAE